MEWTTSVCSRWHQWSSLLSTTIGKADTYSESKSKNGQNGGFAIGAGSDANGGGVALNGGNTNDMSSGVALNGGQDHQGCNVAIGSQCFNVPGM